MQPNKQTYQSLLDYIEENRDRLAHEDAWTLTRRYCRSNGLNFFYMRHQLRQHGATCDREVLDVIPQKIPGELPITDIPNAYKVYASGGI